MVIVSLLSLPIPYLIKFIIDDVIIAKNLNLLNLLIFLIIGIQIIKMVFSFLTSYVFGVLSQEITAKIKRDLFNRLLHLPLPFFDKNQSGYLLSRIGEVDRLKLFFSSSMVQILIGFFEVVFSLSILFYMNWRLTLLALLIFPLFFMVMKFQYKGIRKISRVVMEIGADLSRRIQETLSGISVIKVFRAEKKETDRIHNYLNVYKKANIKETVVLNFSSGLLSLLAAIGGFVVLWYSARDIIGGNFTIGSYIAFSAYLGKLYGPTQMLANLGIIIQPVITALERVRELTELSVEDDGHDRLRVKRLKGEIEFQKVSFSYNHKEVLREISFKIRAGEKVVLMGSNGSGKSTIIKLIFSLYKQKNGIIMIDGLDIKKLSLSSLRDRMSIVSQNTFLFNDTIRNNILYSRPEATNDEVETATRDAGAYNFILKKENGFDTVVGERGKLLSGGERQKISIARAILKDADILLFDEADSHLDRKSELKLWEIINNRFRNKTCIIISNKNTLQSEIDKKLIIEGGVICKSLNLYDTIVRQKEKLEMVS